MNNYYKLYVEKNLNLAETIVIKLDDAAAALNYQVMSTHGLSSVDQNDKSSWKYYQNISGSYHFSDTTILVNSLDTADVIAFTKENLSVHVATRQAYEFGSRYYRELLLQHPNQELLILGILYPSDIHAAIDAIDGTIISYPVALVELNEYSLVPKLQAWIYKYLDRWVNKQFGISDDLYVATYVGQLYLHLVQAITAFRLEACKTNEAHSFHIQHYLASHGMLDSYLSAMTKYQALFLYRNILYIQRHSGKKDTFNWLVDNVLTHRNLPLYEYAMIHDVSKMQRPSQLDDTHLLPQIRFKRKPLNSPADNVEKNVYSLDYLLGKIEPIAKGNAVYQTDNKSEIENTFAYSLSSVSTTKMLESNITDYSDAVVYTLEHILLNHWLALVGSNLYEANVVVDLPGSGDSIRLEAQPAVALFVYALHKALASEPGSPSYAPLIYVPTIETSRVIKRPIPSLKELLSITERKYISSEEVSEIHSSATLIEDIKSIDIFFKTCQKLYSAAQLQYAMYASKENKYARSDAQAAVAKLYSDEVVQLNLLAVSTAPYQGLAYVEFLQSLALDFSSYTKENFYNLALEIVSVATGVKNMPSSSLRDMQKAMVNLFTKLSSYSIQVTAEINDSNIVIAPNPAIRIGSAVVIESKRDNLDASMVRVHGVTGGEAHIYGFDLNKESTIKDPSFMEHITVGIDFTSKFRQLSEFRPIGAIQVRTPVTIESSFDFTSSAKAMTLEQRASLVDIY